MELIEDCLAIIASFIHILGGFQNNTLKDILLLYIFWNICIFPEYLFI